MKNKIEQENNEMLRNQIKEAQHHSSELKSVVSSSTQVEPWVVAKMERATTDLSDIAHYLDGRKDMKMATGGNLGTREEQNQRFLKGKAELELKGLQDAYKATGSKNQKDALKIKIDKQKQIVSRFNKMATGGPIEKYNLKNKTKYWIYDGDNLEMLGTALILPNNYIQIKDPKGFVYSLSLLEHKYKNLKFKIYEKFAKGGLTPSQEAKVGKVMHEFKEGKLHSGSKQGPVVTNRKQAIAIALAEANAMKMKQGGSVPTFKSRKLAELKEWKKEKLESIKYLANRIGINNKNSSYIQAEKKLDELVEDCTKIIKSGILKDREYFYRKTFNITTYKGSLETECYLTLNKEIAYSHPKFEKDFAEFNKKYPYSTKSTFAKEFIGRLTIPILGYKLCDYTTLGFDKGDSVGGFRKNSFEQGGSMYEDGGSTDNTIYKVAGRTVTLNKGSKSDGTDWTVTFMNGQIKPLSDVLALIKPFPKGIQKMENGGSMYKDGGNLTYGEAQELGDKMRFIKNHIQEKYPQFYYGQQNNILGKAGREIPASSIAKLKKLAKEKNDLILQKALVNLNAKMKDGGDVNSYDLTNLPVGATIRAYDPILDAYLKGKIISTTAKGYEVKTIKYGNVTVGYSMIEEVIALPEEQKTEPKRSGFLGLFGKMKDGGDVNSRFSSCEKWWDSLSTDQRKKIIEDNDLQFATTNDFDGLTTRGESELKTVFNTINKPKMKDGGVAAMSTVNEIGRLSGLRPVAIAEWGDKNNINLTIILKDLKSKKIKGIDLMSAIVGRPNNKYSKQLLSTYSKMENGGPVEGDLTNLSNLERYVNAHKAEIKANRKTYGFMSVAKITNPYDFSSLLGVDSRIFRNAEIPYYAKFVATLLR
jgi:hypothetical protein